MSVLILTLCAKVHFIFFCTFHKAANVEYQKAELQLAAAMEISSNF